MNVLVLGKGFISEHLSYKKYIKHITTDEIAFQKNIIDVYRPDVIINCIGRTGSPNVDWCESNKAETAEANINIPLMMASATEKYGIKLIHLGSGCIYFGQSPNKYYDCGCNFSEECDCDSNIIDTGWKETDFANPKSFYSKTKYAADLALSSMEHVTILRLRMPISSLNTPRNLLNKLIGYPKVLEQLNSVTFINDLVKAVDWSIKKNKTGIYHVTSPVPLTHSVFLDEYKKYVPKHIYSKINESELDTMVAAKRSNCILDSNKIIKEGFEFTDTYTNVRRCIKDFVLSTKI